VEGDRYQVGRRLKIDWLHRFIDMEHGPMEQNQGRRCAPRKAQGTSR
jgi:hypothetical protein